MLVMNESPRLLSLDEVRKRLGIGRNLVYELAASNALHTIRLGRLIRVSEAELARFIREREAASEGKA